MLNNAFDLNDLRIPPVNHLEKLSGKLAGYYSIIINQQWRIIFNWKYGNAGKVEIMDYHWTIVIMAKLKNILPGEVLKEKFLEPLGITAYRLTKDTFIQQTRISEILKGRRKITADSALRFAKYFGTSPRFWLGLQDDFDLEEETTNLKSELDEIPNVNSNAA